MSRPVCEEFGHFFTNPNRDIERGSSWGGGGTPEEQAKRDATLYGKPYKAFCLRCGAMWVDGTVHPSIQGSFVPVQARPVEEFLNELGITAKKAGWFA